MITKGHQRMRSIGYGWGWLQCCVEMEVSQRVYVMRHGERLDSIDRQWTKRAARPYDTPLSRHGEHEAMRLVKQRLTNKDIEIVYASPFLRCLQTADIACKALGVEGLHTHNHLCEFLHPGNRVTTIPQVPAIEDIKDIKVLTFDSTPLPNYPETAESANTRYREAVNELADRHWPASVLMVTHELCVRESYRWAGSKEEIEATYCGHVELEREEKDSRDWRVCSYHGVYKYDNIIE